MKCGLYYTENFLFVTALWSYISLCKIGDPSSLGVPMASPYVKSNMDYNRLTLLFEMHIHDHWQSPVLSDTKYIPIKINKHHIIHMPYSANEPRLQSSN